MSTSNNKAVELVLVEDNRDEAELTIRALEQHHLANNLVHLKDGAEAMDYLLGEDRPANPLRIVLLDIGLLKMNGLEVLAKIRSDQRTKDLTVFILTSSREQRDQMESQRLGVSAYITKPVSFGKLVAALAVVGQYSVQLRTRDM